MKYKIIHWKSERDCEIAGEILSKFSDVDLTLGYLNDDFACGSKNMLLGYPRWINFKRLMDFIRIRIQQETHYANGTIPHLQIN